MADVLAFWAAALVVAAVGFPFAAVLLRRLPDAGAGLAMPLGLLFVSWPYFILRTFDILPPGRRGYVAALVLAALAAVMVAGADRWLRVSWWRAWPGVLVAFGVFTFAFFGYVALRSYNAEIGGTEQPMDLLYLNAALTSEDYPPRDPWLAGEPASYYYFGYVQSGVLTALSGVPASTGYNLSLAYTFAAGATGAGSLAFAMARWVLGSRGRRWAIAAGGLAITLLLFVGSLAAVFEWTAAHGQDRIEAGPIELYRFFGAEEIVACQSPQSENCYGGTAQPRTTEWYPTEFWFWFRDTRIIPRTITEFPFFSFLLGDLHPHVMSIPLVLLVLGLVAATWRGRSTLDWRALRGHPWLGLATAILLGALAFQNAWDVLTFSAAFGLAVFARNVRRQAPLAAAASTVTYLAPISVAALVAYLPWALDFSSQAGGLKPYAGTGTLPAHVLLQFGPPIAASSLIALLATRGTRRETALNVGLGTAWIPLLPFLAWIALARVDGVLDEAVSARTAGGWWTMGIYAALVWLLAYAAVAFALRRSAAALPAALAATGVLLLYGSELFFIKDVFVGSYPRQNTVFKLSYQAWMLLSVAGGTALAVALSRARWRPAYLAGAVPAGALVVLGLVYPLLASFNRTEGFSLPQEIDGFAALRQADPDEYALVRWIDENTPRDAVILEATGRRWQPSSGAPVLVDPGVDYTDAGRISARTGRATPIGWYFHEVQWRGDSQQNRAEFSRRQDMVDAAYTARDPGPVLAAMREFGASYLVVGRVEMSRYPGLMQDFGAFLDVAFQSGNYVIYRLPEYRTVPTS